MGLDPGESARACLLAARLADRSSRRPARRLLTTLLLHVGCTAWGPRGGCLTSAVTRSPQAVALLEGFEGRAPLSMAIRVANCEVAALTARRIGLGRGGRAGARRLVRVVGTAAAAAVRPRRRRHCLPSVLPAWRPTPPSSTGSAAAELALKTVAENLRRRRSGRGGEEAPRRARSLLARLRTPTRFRCGAPCRARGAGGAATGSTPCWRAFAEAVDLKTPAITASKAGVAELAGRWR